MTSVKQASSSNAPSSTAAFVEEEEEESKFDFEDVDEEAVVKQRNSRIEKMGRIQVQIAKEIKMKQATESMLQLYSTGLQRDETALGEVQIQLDALNTKIKTLQSQYEHYKVYNERENAKTRPRNSDKPDSDFDVSLRKSGSVSNVPTSWRSRLSHFRADTVTGSNSRKRPTLNIMRGLLSNLADILVSLNAREGDSQTKLDALNNLVKVVKSTKIEPHSNVEDILKTLRIFLCSSVMELRGSSFRAIRYLITDEMSVTSAWAIGLEVFLIRALCRDSKFDAEREQAVKLIRVFAESSHTAKTLPVSVISSLAAISEQPDDKMRGIALETLCELAIRNISLVSAAGGLRCIFQTLVDGSVGVNDFIIPTISFLLDTPENRFYIHPEVDVEMALFHFTDAYNKDASQSDRLKACSRAVVNLLKTWPGLLILASDELRAVRSLVDALRLPYEDNTKFLINTLFDIFQLEMPKWLPDLVSARGVAFSITSASANADDPSAARIPDYDGYHYGAGERANLADHYLALILVIFVEAGLVESLVSIIEEGSKSLVTLATILVGELLQLCNRLLPISYCARVQSLPKLFMLASTFDDENVRNLGSWSLAQVEQLTHEFAKNPRSIKLEKTLQAVVVEEAHRLHKEKQLDTIKLRLGVQIEDFQFKNLINDSLVPLGKDFNKWNWGIIEELLQGALLNPRRLEETLKTTKFVKRLLAFFRPNKHRYSDIKVGKNSSRYTRIGVSLFKMLLSNQDGIKYLSENKIFPQFLECFTELDPVKGSVDPIFSKDRLENTLTGDYFLILSIFFKRKEGQELLEKFKIIDSFYHLTELRSRDDLVKGIITCMNYRRDGHPRIILSKVMTSGYKHIRLFATAFLRKLVLTDSHQFSDWGVRLLITQLYDPAIEVCETAVMALDEACQNPTNLTALITLRPSLDHLSEVGNPLLYRFMSHVQGFTYLTEIGYVEKELDFWFKDGNSKYVIQMEVSLGKALYPRKKANGAKYVDAKLDDTIRNKVSDEDGICIPHFYGELVKTDEGCQMLRDSKHFTHFCEIIRNYASGEWKDPNIIPVKAALWAIGNIGSAAGGILFLDESNVVKDIVALSENANTLTLRGTCYFVLGLISKNPEATEILEDHGWNSVSSLYNKAGLCIPTRLSRFLQVPAWDPKNDIPRFSNSALFASKDPIAADILKNIGNLSNQILASASSKALTKLKQENPQKFADAKLYLTVLKIVNSYHYRLTARRFATDLFEGVDLLAVELPPLEVNSRGPSMVANKLKTSLARNGSKKTLAFSAESGEAPVSPAAQRRAQLVDARKVKEIEPRLVVEGFTVQ